MRILFILPYSPIPTNTGNKNLTFNLLKHLDKKISIDIIIFEDLKNDKNKIFQQIKYSYPNINNVYIFDRNKNIKCLLYKFYFLIRGLHPALGNYYKFKIAKWLRINSCKYDLIHFDMFLVSPYIKSIKNIPTLLVASDAYTLTASLDIKNIENYIMKIYVIFKKFLIENIEKYFYKKFTQIVCVSNIDSKHLIKKLKIKDIISIGIPISENLKDRKIQHHINILKNNSSTRLLITGNLNHPFIAKNIISFLNNVIPEILKNYPNLKTVILGKNPIN